MNAVHKSTIGAPEWCLKLSKIGSDCEDEIGASGRQTRELLHAIAGDDLVEGKTSVDRGDMATWSGPSSET